MKTKSQIEEEIESLKAAIETNENLLDESERLVQFYRELIMELNGRVNLLMWVLS